MQNHRIIRPPWRDVLKLSLIMCALISLAFLQAKEFKLEFLGFPAFIFLFIILLSYSCRITYNTKELRQYRCFFFFSRIKIAEIKDIKYLPFSKKGRARVLEAKLGKGKIKDIFVALYSIENANEIINFVRQNNNIQTPLKLANNKSIFLSKKNKNGIIAFFVSIATILIVSLLIKSLF